MAELRAALQAAKRAHAIADSCAYDGTVIRYMLDQAEQELRLALLNSPDAVPAIVDQPHVAQGVINRVDPILLSRARATRTSLAAFRARTRTVEPPK